MNTEKQGTVTVRVGSRSYELDSEGNPKIGSGKYPEGDCRRQGPSYVHRQRASRIREERRERMSEHAKKAGFRSNSDMVRAQRLTANSRAPKHTGRTKALKRDARSREERPSKFSQALARGLAALARLGGAL